MSFNLALLAEYGPQLRHGLQITILLWLAGSAIAAVIGFICGFGAALGPVWLRRAVRCYVELFRGTPLLVQVFLVYSGGPHIGITLGAMTVGIGGLGLYGGAYFTETVRAGVLGIPNGQIEAGRAFGLTRLQIIRTVMLPQMLVLSLPPTVNLLIFLLKDTAVLSILTIPELTFEVTGMTLETFAFVEPFLALAIGYWVLVELTAIAGRFAEQRLSRRLGMAL
jgi:polar amino acid transport system permease protein